jgi:hypothetical protein
MPQLQILEDRAVPAASPLGVTAHTNYIIEHPFAGPGGGGGSGGPAGNGYTPAQILHAYGIDQIKYNGVQADGTGTTIAIVDAYSDPNITSDLHTFDQAFGLPDPTMSIVNQSGGSNLPQGNTSWGAEISLDVEWAHSIAPGAKILLVEANNDAPTNLTEAAAYAGSVSGVVAVSNSWGTSEFDGETTADPLFMTPPGHTPEVFLAASGDHGAPANYPAASPDVLAVGGTSTNLDSTGNIISESGWSGSGGGPSVYESQPSWQKGVVTQTTTQRATPDVAWNADPATGVAFYDTYSNSGPGGWAAIGGTSVASPSWAGLIAITDQGRALAGESPLGNTTLMPVLYSLQSDFHDITTGTSTGNPTYKAGPGYDYVTGLGTPIANTLVPALIGTGGTTSPIEFTHLAVNPNPINIGGTGTLTCSFSDPIRPTDAYQVTINWGDGAANTNLILNPGQDTFGATHQFEIAGTSSDLVTVTVTDSIGDKGIDTTTVSIVDVPPTAQITNVPVGSQPDTKPISLGSLVTSPSNFSTYTYAWTVTDNGNPFMTATTQSLTFTPSDMGSYVVSLTVTDQDGESGVASPVAILVFDAPPSASSLTTGGPVKLGKTATLTLNSPTAASGEVSRGLLYSFSNSSSFSGTWNLLNQTTATATVPASALPSVGNYTFYAKIEDKDGTISAIYTTTVVVNVTGGGDGGNVATNYVVAGSGATPGVTSEVQVFGSTGKLVYTLTPFGTNYFAGYRVATTDYNGDGTEDFIVAPGPGGGPNVEVINGANPLQILATFAPYGATYNGGFYVAGGDWNLDGYGDVVISPDKGSAHPVVAYSGANGSQLWSYSPFGTTYTGGVSIALGDVNGDGYLDLISGQLSTGSKVQVNLNNKAGGITTNSIYRSIAAALPALYNGGVTVASGNLNGSSTASIIVGSNSTPGHESLVQVYNGGASGGVAYSFAPFSAYSLGVRVATENLGGSDDMVIAPATASKATLFGNPTVLVLKGNLAGAFMETMNDEPFQGGVFVG